MTEPTKRLDEKKERNSSDDKRDYENRPPKRLDKDSK